MGAGASRASLRFALSYALLCGLFFACYFVFTFPYSGWPYRLFTGYLHLYATAAGAVLHAFDPLVSVSRTKSWVERHWRSCGAATAARY